MLCRRPRRVALLFVLILTLGVAASQGCSSEARRGPDQMHQNITESESSETTAAPPAPSEPKEDALYEPTIELTGTEIAVITTAKGTIRLELFGDVAPNHVKSFVELAQKGFYDGTTFHRVIPNFMAQGGDPFSRTGEGPVGTGGPGYHLAAEFSDLPHLEGTLSMARSTDPNSAGSQFFICFSAQPHLDGQYTVFGKVIEGMAVVHSITQGDAIESVRIENAAG